LRKRVPFTVYSGVALSRKKARSMLSSIGGWRLHIARFSFVKSVRIF
jgi:hypothetical protein